MDFVSVVEVVGESVDAAGIVVIVVGSVLALGTYCVRLSRGVAHPVAYQQVRRNLGRAILLGLELLVAGDIIRTVAATPTFANVGVLAIIILIRTLLSFTLIVETEGRWPWQKSEDPRETEPRE